MFKNNKAFNKKKLGSLCIIKKGHQINAIDLFDIGKYYVMNGGVNPSGYYDNYNTEADTISISEGGNSCGYVQYNDSKFWSGGHCYTLEDIDKQIVNEYLYFYLKSEQEKIMALRVGSGLPNIQKKDLERLEVNYPNIEKQNQITNFLSRIDAKLELEKSLLLKYNEQKQYLLDSLFI